MYHEFQYEVDITSQGKSIVNEKLREVFQDIRDHANQGKQNAQGKSNEVRELLTSYQQRKEGYLNEIKAIQRQIDNINGKVDEAMIGISADCISQCKTGK